MEADKKSKVYKALHSKFDDASILNEDEEVNDYLIYFSDLCI